MIILFQLPWYSRTFINSNSTNSVLCNTLAHCAKRIRKWISESEMCHCANRIFSVTSVISHCAKRILIFFIGEHPLRKKNFQIWWSLRILRIFASLSKKNLSHRIFTSCDKSKKYIRLSVRYTSFVPSFKLILKILEFLVVRKNI